MLTQAKKKVEIESLLGSAKKIRGVWTPPADKSLTHRAFFLSALSPSKSVVKNPLLSGDCLSTLNAFKSLGVPILKKGTAIFFAAGKKRADSPLRQFYPPKGSIDCGNSGTTMRLLCGVLSSQNFTSTLVGDASLSKRPMRRVMEPLSKMGVKIVARSGNFAPLKVFGNPELKAIYWKSSVASAQVKSSILLAGLYARGKTIYEEPERSRDHTERMLKSLGANIQFNAGAAHAGYNKIVLEGPAKLRGLDFEVPGDFSSAAFMIAAALLVPGSSLTVKNVNLNPTRTGLLSVLKRMGAKFRITGFKNKMGELIGEILAEYGSLRGTSLLRAEIPYLIDEIPILAVLATQAKGKTVISGAEELRVKESDRIRVMVTNLKKMGAQIEERKDGMAIDGPTPLGGCKVSSHGDHRIAMAMSVAALIAKRKTAIGNFDCVKISFPNFLAELKALIR